MKVKHLRFAGFVVVVFFFFKSIELLSIVIVLEVYIGFFAEVHKTHLSTVLEM